ncbi:serine/threonine-protein kinase [Aliiglaciecola sp. M165]|uniref:serine/threonine-protein kinase n=1 Tax=Aliiglaciecola sp. M165 TaxID=2593649 RepID=UPI00117EEA44|nr:serine/threonine-protein kinase [Aliiglaciecola sp. M165]TRY32513.1 protein kinase [Aliiglaciecola sp. M165]
MLDWAKITGLAEHALTFNTKELTEFLNALPDSENSKEISKLLHRLRPTSDFLATSVSDATTDEASLASGTLIGPWKIDKMIGRGGMGEVYLAFRADGLYEQRVALKLISGLSVNRDMLFEIERRRLAQMDHPNIARIIDGGNTDDGRPYMVMEYVDGEPICRYAANLQLDLKQRLKLFIAVCNAVDYAHNKLVLHQDIKSSNIIIGANGTPRLIDFGIASDLHEETGSTAALTLASAAPEQLKGQPLSVQTDIFALGILLHELVSKERPTRLSNGGMETDTSAIKDQDLNAIISHALSYEPSNRYASAALFAEDVKAILDKRPVSVRPGKFTYKASRFLKRNPFSTALAVTTVSALIIGILVSLKYANDANHQGNLATLALEKANWQFQRTEATLAAQQAYSDVLQRAFGGEEDVERLSQLLKQRWQTAFDNRENDPNTAAALSYAIGRNFYFRGDTASGIEIFDAWMASESGSEALRALGEEAYALMLYDTGRFEESIEILRGLVAFFGDGSQTSEADASNYANRLARSTRAPEDIARSVDLLENRLATTEAPFERLFAYSQLAGMRTLQANFEEATFAYGQTLQIFLDNPGFAAYGRDISRFNYASILLAWQNDYDAAYRLVNDILEEDVPLKGESIQQARALMLKACVEANKGNSEQAIALIDDALPLFERFAGENSALHFLAKGMQAYVLLLTGKSETALAYTEDLQAKALAADSNGRTMNFLKLMHVYVLSERSEVSQADLEWLETPDVHNDASSNMLMLYIYKRLADKQLAPAFWEDSNQPS